MSPCEPRPEYPKAVSPLAVDRQRIRRYGLASFLPTFTPASSSLVQVGGVGYLGRTALRRTLSGYTVPAPCVRGREVLSNRHLLPGASEVVPEVLVASATPCSHMSSPVPPAAVCAGGGRRLRLRWRCAAYVGAYHNPWTKQLLA